MNKKILIYISMIYNILLFISVSFWIIINTNLIAQITIIFMLISVIINVFFSLFFLISKIYQKHYKNILIFFLIILTIKLLVVLKSIFIITNWGFGSFFGFGLLGYAIISIILILSGFLFVIANKAK